jgi:UDP-GlcNAc:undecaprenyl-phosphate/decaprenyl-phosphate GlcNAc-1-phosphate transferase
VHWLPLVVSLVAALAITPTTVRGLARQGVVRQNYRGVAVACPAGITIVASALVALIVLAPLFELVNADVFRGGIAGALTFVIGVAFLGLLDDLIGSDPRLPRGWRGHFSALAAGRVSTGALKAIGTLGLALVVAGPLLVFADASALIGRHGNAFTTFTVGGFDTGRYLLGAAVLVLATNVFNLLDLRPGRSAKALILLGTGLSAGAWTLNPFFAVSLFLGPILVLLPLELREVGMLGDTGSNAIGAVAGVWLVLTLSTLGQAIAAAILLVITVYGEFRSISELIERTPGLRQLDLLGRSHV